MDDSRQGKKLLLKNHNLGDDFLYHIGIGKNDNLPARFGDVKYVCMGGKNGRMKEFAYFMYEKLGKPQNSEFGDSENEVIKDIAKEADRYAMFKVGPVLSISHGIGMPSLSVILNEVLKLLNYAGASDVVFIRMGTCGGLGYAPGTIVVTNKSFNSSLEPVFKQVICGKEYSHQCKTDENIRNSLVSMGKKIGLAVEEGNTMATDDFFEEQARLDGAFCEITDEEKLAFVRRIHDDLGIKNMEMESACFTAMCNRAEVKCGVACVSVVNRLERDDVTADGKMLQSWQENLYKLMEQFIVQR